MPAEAANNGGNTTTEKSENVTEQTKKAPVIFLFDVDGTLTMPRQVGTFVLILKQVSGSKFLEAVFVFFLFASGM